MLFKIDAALVGLKWVKGCCYGSVFFSPAPGGFGSARTTTTLNFATSVEIAPTALTFCLKAADQIVTAMPMPKPVERRRKPRRKAVHVTGPAWVMLENVPGARADIRAKVVDFNETGIRIHVSLLLQANYVVVVKGQAAGVVPNGKASARVVDCRALTGSGYTVGLTFEEASDRDKQDKTPAMDHYEILEKRAAYDVHLGSTQKFRLQILDQGEAAAVKEAERSKRRGILELLYSARRNQPGQATVSIHELEELLGCPREHLDFSLWYLKENALISSSENERYSITAKGVDHLETEEVARTPKERLLGAGD